MRLTFTRLLCAILIAVFLVNGIPVRAADEPSPEFVNMIRNLVDDIPDGGNACQQKAVLKAKLVGRRLVLSEFVSGIAGGFADVLKTLLEALFPLVGKAFTAKELFDAAMDSNNVSDFAKKVAEKVAKDAVGGKGEEAGEIAGKLITDKLTDAAFKAFKDWLAGLHNEYYPDTEFSDLCHAHIGGQWTKKAFSMVVVISGDCECHKDLNDDVLLKDWTVQVFGKVAPVFEDGKIAWEVHFVRAVVRAQCCGPGDPCGYNIVDGGGESIILGEPFPQTPGTIPAPPPATVPPTTVTPTTMPPQQPNPDEEKVKRLQDHADRMKRILDDCHTIEQQIADVQAQLRQNAADRQRVKDAIAKAQKALDDFVSQNTTHTWIHMDADGNVVSRQEVKGPQQLNPPFQETGSSFPKSKQKERDQLQKAVDDLKNQLASLEQQAKDLKAKLKQLVDELNRCHDAGEAVRKECQVTSTYFRTDGNAYGVPGASDALQGYDEGAKGLDKLKEKLNNLEPQVGMKESLKEGELASLRALEDDKDVSVSLAGEDRAAGEIFQIEVANDSDQPVFAYIPSGVVLVPTNPGYQSMLLDDSVSVCVSEHAKVDLPVRGYCINHDKLPPPPTDMPLVPEGTPNPDAHAPTAWTIPENQTPYEPLARIVETGDDLSLHGKYSSGIQDPAKYRIGIIERALWYYTTQNTDHPEDKAALAKDIDKQLANLPPDKQPSREEKQKVVDNIWNDVDLTLKESKEEK